MLRNQTIALDQIKDILIEYPNLLDMFNVGNSALGCQALIKMVPLERAKECKKFIRDFNSLLNENLLKDTELFYTKYHWLRRITDYHTRINIEFKSIGYRAAADLKYDYATNKHKLIKLYLN